MPGDNPSQPRVGELAARVPRRSNLGTAAGRRSAAQALQRSEASRRGISQAAFRSRYGNVAQRAVTLEARARGSLL